MTALPVQRPPIVALKLMALLSAALVIRLAVMVGPGHTGDLTALVRWAEDVAATGLPGYYASGGDGNYPAAMYLLWPLGVALDGAELRTAVRGISIPFDLLIGVALYGVGRSLSSAATGLRAAAVYLFNPGAVLAGAFWGQLDSVGTTALLGALLASAAGRHGMAGGLAVVAALVKPQFAIGVAIVLAAIALRTGGEARIRPLTRAAVGGILAFLAVTLPLRISPPELWAIVAETAARMPFTSLHGFNMWSLLFGFERPDGPFVYLGTALVLVGGLGALLLLRRRQDVIGLFAVAALLAFAVYFLPTRVHERYLFPAIAVLAPLAAARSALFRPYLAMSSAFAASLLYVLILGRRSQAIIVAPSVEHILEGPGAPLIAVALMATASWCALRLWQLFHEARASRLDLPPSRRSKEPGGAEPSPVG